MAQCSEDELYQRADNLVRHAGQHFQSLFLQRWEVLTQTRWSGKVSVQLLVDMLGVHLSRLLLPHQKSQLVKGLVEEWDITLLSRLLIHFNKEDNDEADQAIYSITNVRNKLAHTARKKLNFEEYFSIERLVKTNLIILGMEEKVIEDIISQAEATSLNSVLEQLKKFQAEGDDLVKKKSYEKAIQAYSHAMLLPNLLPGHLSVLYENRGFCHMSISNKNFQLKKAQLDLAFSDGEKAIELNIDSWKGHHILASIYQGRGKLDDALIHYHRAIAISPGQPEVKDDLDACEILAGKAVRQDHLDPNQWPMSLSEHIQKCNEETGRSFSEEDFLKLGKRPNKQFPGRDSVIKGYQHLQGWQVPQNYSEAAKHFAKARQVGNAEGIYNLAVLYKDGLGVQRDIPFAVELFFEAANKPEKTDIGVLGAQHWLGQLYEEGVGVSKDLGKAVYWLKKAADNGCGNAANNLAHFYLNGKGVPINDKLAETYWKIGVANKNMHSAQSLAAFYVQRMEPELAKSYFNMSIELGNDRLKTSKGEAFEMIDRMAKDRAKLEGDIKAFEEANKLDTRGLNFSERMKREASSRSPEMAKLADDMDKLRVGEDGITTPQIWGRTKEELDAHELVRKAQQGYKTAQNIAECLLNNDRFIKLWEQGQPRTLAEIEELISPLYLCLCTEAILFKLPSEMLSAVPQFVNKLFKKFGGEKSKLDLQLRLCMFYMNTGVGGVDKLHTELLAEGLRRYPDEIELYRALSCAYVNLKQFRKGLEVCTNGLLKWPSDPDLLQGKAAHLRLLEKGSKAGEKIREAYKRFIENAPKDHRMLPEAYYAIAYSYSSEKKMKKKEVDELICHYYGLGEESEKALLSCYLPYGSNAKLVLRNIMLKKKMETKAIKSLDGKGAIVSDEKTYLKDPKRIEMIKKHREWAERTRKDLQMPYQTALSVTPKLVHKIPKSLNQLKAITLPEMNPTKDQIYEGRFLNLTVIEGPFFGRPSIPLVVEDDRGETTRLAIYNVEQNEQARETFGVGAKFAVINPYMRMAADGQNAIRVDDPKCIIHNEGVKDMCRYCGKEGAKSYCARCMNAKYCGKECQEMDWKILKHKLICFSGESK